ncbi:hypothetical protein SYNPS1DRAFT_30058 [Syncephalis pseudoplumigaleata]|uniref:Uncharacterized protein n=1 Tax=Syncephalis pseudoplumigaleata TaxID=1712513 RepID=A0A4P9YWE9_9FUNG|nr:hypothetical protein SYNPS1DRAFT_30058 [Syncephalis pseudoplumigaleata]|eukprot:RKP24175.1 hypothetical protein SYNPS1DRAFT_30058 [Syncephalis pseudoplumigaleata]
MAGDGMGLLHMEPRGVQLCSSADPQSTSIDTAGDLPRDSRRTSGWRSGVAVGPLGMNSTLLGWGESPTSGRRMVCSLSGDATTSPPTRRACEPAAFALVGRAFGRRWRRRALGRLRVFVAYQSRIVR